ncbi:unnamed protein product [Ranitomeya imitator]|uniref:HAT C-terminal dimerisation domain-containing protein n=1 Tax=Ranitomeya imitator TaxID=111125 RepID=A0ABN9KNB9_9NEOB|nr:unnamed protein product [Ranitomeya imitator]
MYKHKSGSQKRKEKRDHNEEEERLKKKSFLSHYFKKPQSTKGGDDDTGESAASSSFSSVMQEEAPTMSTDVETEECAETRSTTMQEEAPTMPTDVETEECAETRSTTMSLSPSPSHKMLSSTVCIQMEKEEMPSCSSSIIEDVCEEPSCSQSAETLFPETCTLVTEEGEDGGEDGGEDEINWKDPAMWPDDIKDKEREKIVLSGLSNEEELKQMVKSLPKDVDDRSFSDFLLYAKSSNGREKFIRDWLRWSPSKKVMYCVACMAFSDDKRSILCRKEGFNPMVSKWHRLYLKLPEHEHSALHRKHYWSWRSRQKAQVGHGVDFEMQRSLAKEAERLVALLERLLDVTLHLASRNMAFRGTSQRIGDLHNGNFLGTLEILSRYDSVLKEHLEKVKISQEKGKKMPAHYLSWATQNEFINICGKHVLDAILSERKEAIYFSVICDATPDVSHTEQNVIVLRAVVLATFWVKVLTSFEERNKILQSRSVSLEVGAANIKALSEEMKLLREKWPTLLSEASLVADCMGIPKDLLNAQQLRQRRSKHHEAASPEEHFKVNVFLVAMDTIISDLHQRFRSMEDICKLFAPILKMTTISEENLVASTEELIAAYPEDLTSSLLSELQHLRKVYEATFTDNMGPLDLLNAIYKFELQGIFGEVCIALRIFITLPLSVAEGERAFSKLSLVKNYLRSTMTEQRLNSLALLSIEHELARRLNFKDLITDFAKQKVRVE